MRKLIALLALTMGTASASELCLTKSENGFNYTWDCTFGFSHHEWIGYRTWGGPPCGANDGEVGCAPIQAGNASFVWTISASQTDPLQNTGPVVDGDLYLWLYCTATTGVETAEFDLTGTIVVTAFEAFPPFSNSGTATELKLSATECPGEAKAPVLAGRIAIEPGTVAVDQGSWGRTKSQYR
jgi:hypothetical protein